MWFSLGFQGLTTVIDIVVYSIGWDRMSVYNIYVLITWKHFHELNKRVLKR